MKIIAGYQNTKGKEDFAITPYISGIWSKGKYKVYGLSFCWGWWCVFISIALNAPKGFPNWVNLKYK